MKWWIPTILGIILILGNVGSVHAWGVAYSEKEIAMQKGETHVIRTSLQNMMGDEAITVSISLRGDTSIAELSKNEVMLPPKTKSYPIYITITIPSNAPKDQYTLTAVYTQKQSGGAMVNLAMEKSITFTIDASGNPPKTSTSNNNNLGTPPNQPPSNEPDEGVIFEQPISNENQDIQIPIVPNITNQEMNSTEPVTKESTSSWLWTIIIVAIIGIIWFLWWDGWI
jgi:hypothetical protein